MNVSVTIKGLPELERRLKAIGDTGSFMRDYAILAVGEQKKLAPVKTGNLRRTIHIGQVTKRSATTVASANYAAAVEFGTRAHEIRPRNRKALRWKGKAGGVVFASRVRHPGTRKQPYMVPGAERAVHGLRDRLIERWNRAA